MNPKPANPVCLNFVTALSCEAKPLIDHYGLVKQASAAFPYFFKPACEQHRYKINLLVSGIGMQAMATACGWLAGMVASAPAVWLNVGTAGHATLALGEIVRVVSVTQSDTDSAHFPPLVAKWSGVNAPLISSAAPVLQYPEELLVDMEASAFFTAAKRFASAELVQSLKVVSDNKKNSIEQLNAAKLSAFVASKMNSIDVFGRALVELAATESTVAHTSLLAHNLHCTHSQAQQFKDLANKLINLQMELQDINCIIEQAASMKVLLQELRRHQETTIPDLKKVSGDQPNQITG